MEQQQPKKQPEKVWRDGNIKATMFRNEGALREDGSRAPDFFSTGVVKVYRDKAGEWRETHFLSGAENLKAEKLRGAAYEYEQHLRQKDREQDRGKAAPDRAQAQRAMFDEEWHDENKSRADIRRDRFKQTRSTPGTRQQPRERQAR
tara:strand:- start:12298 stop:12738 length:441 start_codon:yes stop_codon:yes gene_type:complete